MDRSELDKVLEAVRAADAAVIDCLKDRLDAVEAVARDLLQYVEQVYPKDIGGCVNVNLPKAKEVLGDE